jgi:hypothetical protein
MKMGIKELREEFKGIKWFERKEIRKEDSLSSDEVRWLRQWTFSPIGIANIFYIANPRRRLYDLATVYIATYVFFEVHETFLRPLVLDDSAASLIEKYPLGMFTAAAYFILVVIPFTAASFYSVYFTLRHGRRLSWNRGGWTTIEDLVKSEKRWLYFNTLPSLAIAILLVIAIYFVT